MTSNLWTPLFIFVCYPAQQLAELYYRRWSIELFYCDIKTTMHMEVMLTKSPEMV